MNCPSSTSFSSFFSIVFLGLFFFALSENNFAQTYQGRATAVKANATALNASLVNTAIADTGNLLESGGGTTLSGISGNVPNVLTVGSNNASTSGSLNSSSSIAGVNDLVVNALSGAVTLGASVINTSATSTCPARVSSGGSTIAGLVLNGNPITVTGEIDQTIQINILGQPAGTLIINEQIQTPGALTVNALHLIVQHPTTLTRVEVVVAASYSGITCSAAPQFNLFTGNGTGVELYQTLASSKVSTLASDTGRLPGGGGTSSSSVTSLGGLLNILSTGVVESNTSGGAAGGNADSTQSDSTVNGLEINALGALQISSTTLGSNTECTCSQGAPVCTGSSSVAGLQVRLPLGARIDLNVTGAENEEFSIAPLGIEIARITFNETSRAVSGPRRSISKNAMHVRLNVVGLAVTDIPLAHSDSGITCGLRPSAAGSTVSGIVYDNFGRPLSGARVILTDQDGAALSALSNSFGQFQIENIGSGRIYIATVSARGLRFPPQLVNVDDNVTDLLFFAQSDGLLWNEGNK